MHRHKGQNRRRWRQRRPLRWQEDHKTPWRQVVLRGSKWPNAVPPTLSLDVKLSATRFLHRRPVRWLPSSSVESSSKRYEWPRAVARHHPPRPQLTSPSTNGAPDACSFASGCTGSFLGCTAREGECLSQLPSSHYRLRHSRRLPGRVTSMVLTSDAANDPTIALDATCMDIHTIMCTVRSLLSIEML